VGERIEAHDDGGVGRYRAPPATRVPGVGEGSGARRDPFVDLVAELDEQSAVSERVDPRNA
jgi:hypothetical protein